MQRRPGVPDRIWQVLAAISTVLIAVSFGVGVTIILASCG